MRGIFFSKRTVSSSSLCRCVLHESAYDYTTLALCQTKPNRNTSTRHTPSKTETCPNTQIVSSNFFRVILIIAKNNIAYNYSRKQNVPIFNSCDPAIKANFLQYCTYMDYTYTTNKLITYTNTLTLTINLTSTSMYTWDTDTNAHIQGVSQLLEKENNGLEDHFRSLYSLSL